MDYLEFIARVTSYILDKRQVTVRCFGLYTNAHRGKVRKASLEAFPLRMKEEELLMAAESSAEYLSCFSSCPRGTARLRSGAFERLAGFLTRHEHFPTQFDILRAKIYTL